jgi:mono/diheme cytochrome c family protein
MRELLRKPFVVYGYMYTNGIRKESIPELDNKGFLASCKWAPLGLTASSTDVDRGRAIFRYQCLGCHTEGGYRSMSRLLGERDKDAIEGFLTTIHNTDKEKNPYSGIMPPVAGNDQELKDLAAYLDTINHEKRIASKAHLGAAAPASEAAAKAHI